MFLEQDDFDKCNLIFKDISNDDYIIEYYRKEFSIIKTKYSKCYYKGIIYHREDGPAVIRQDETGQQTQLEWWVDGKFIKTQFQ